MNRQASVPPLSFKATLPSLPFQPCWLCPSRVSWQTLRFPGTLLIQPTPQNGLLVPSVALVFQMRVLDKRYCLRRMGERDVATLSQIWALLDNLLGR